MFCSGCTHAFCRYRGPNLQLQRLPASTCLPACPGRLINVMTSCPPLQLSTYLRKTGPSTPSSPASAKQPLAGRLARVWTPPLQSPLSQRRRRAGLCADRLQGYIASVPFRLASIKQCTLVQLTLLICDSSYPPLPFLILRIIDLFSLASACCAPAGPSPRGQLCHSPEVCFQAYTQSISLSKFVPLHGFHIVCVMYS